MARRRRSAARSLPPFVGPLVYLLFRPGEYLADVRFRELELAELELALRHGERCPLCRAPVEPDFLACPVCSGKLKQACAGCGAPVEAVWQMCPWCETPLDEPAVVALGETAQNPGALDELLRSQAKGVGLARAASAGAGVGSTPAPGSPDSDQAFPVTSRAVPPPKGGVEPASLVVDTTGSERRP